MVFSSHLFVFYFLPLALAGYYLCPKPLRHLTLTALSYLFYGWANPIFVLLMAFSTVVDYGCGRLLAEISGSRTRLRQGVVGVSIATNLALLGFFKYANFGIESWNALAAGLGLDSAVWNTTLAVTLPLGISFYTFQSMSYTIDVFRGTARPLRRAPGSGAVGELRSLLDFACYVSLFPQLVAGPIVRCHELEAQLRSRTHTLAKFGRGTAFFCLGFGKKILLANPCGRVADFCFEARQLGIVDAWYGVVAYAFQIYFDFSGYSDMAVGLGLMLGFRLPRNFEHPYRSESITEFWRRWHQSLSRWLRDYLYVPLGGNRKGPVRTRVNLALVMLLGGLWHGAAWNFVVWGAFHGVLLIGERTRGRRPRYRRFPRPIRIATTFVLVLLSWVPFRAADLGAAGDYLASMFGLADLPESSALLAGVVYQPYYLACLVLAGVVVWACPDTWGLTRRLTAPRVIFCWAIFAAALGLLSVQAHNPFIYFIF